MHSVTGCASEVPDKKTETRKAVFFTQNFYEDE